MTQENVQPDPDGGTEDESTDEQLDQSSDVAALRSEAKKHRLQRNEARQELEGARSVIEHYERGVVAGLVGERLADPEDFLSVVNLDDLRADEGWLDAEKVNDAVADLLTRKPHFAKPEQTEDPDLHQGLREDAGKRRPSFADAVKGSLRR